MPFIIAGGLKVLYDLTLGFCFLWKKSHESPAATSEEQFHELEETEVENEKKEMEAK